jgi:DNA-binding response OmpR family regulator
MDREKPVLVVDGTRSIAGVVESFLRQIGFTDIDAAETEDSALKKLMRRSYGLILCDADTAPLPEYQLLQTVDGTGRMVHPRLIVMTSPDESGDGPEPDAEVASEEFLPKPFTVAGLRSVVDSLPAAI